ncbi:MAG: hypothetical protein KDI56_17930, partial [Xanthomonadales bacterium]|nr:hypothetical protein [Xanthomonadales bacterium]
RLEAASRMVDLRMAWAVQSRLAMREADWSALTEYGQRLLATLPTPASDRLSGERVAAQSFADLGRYLEDRQAQQAQALIDTAESVLTRSDVVPYFRASAALAAAVAAQTRGDPHLAQSLQTRGIDALATHMPKAEAAALWARWWPEGMNRLPLE